jgi:hypothetical protein
MSGVINVGDEKRIHLAFTRAVEFLSLLKKHNQKIQL